MKDEHVNCVCLRTNFSVVVPMFVEKHLEESNDIPRLLSKEIKEIYIAELCTLDESIEELKENLKRKFQVG